MSTPPAGILFDHDGTLVDSLDLVEVATNAVLAAYGRGPEPRERIIAGMVLPTGPRIARLLGIDDADRHGEFLAAFAAESRASGVRHVHVYPGIRALLDGLRARGVRLGVVSNNEGGLVRTQLAALGLADYFPVILGEGDLLALKPAPDGLHQACAGLGLPAGGCRYIGDSPTDAAAARAAGIAAVGVAWGTHRRADLVGAGFESVIDRAEELPSMLSAPPPAGDSGPAA